MNQYVVVIQSPDGYDPPDITKAERPAPPNPPKPVVRSALLVDDVTAYLDEAIQCWRNVRDTDAERAEIASCYVDAFQCARLALLGSTLPTEEQKVWPFPRDWVA